MLATVAVLALVTKRCPTYRRRRYGAEQQTRLPYRGAALSVPYVLEQTTKERRDRYVRISAKISTCIPRSYAESSCRSPCVLDAHVRRCMKPPCQEPSLRISILPSFSQFSTTGSCSTTTGHLVTIKTARLLSALSHNNFV